MIDGREASEKVILSPIVSVDDTTCIMLLGLWANYVVVKKAKLDTTSRTSIMCSILSRYNNVFEEHCVLKERNLL